MPTNSNKISHPNSLSRAKQFAPFDALRGFRQKLQEVEAQYQAETPRSLADQNLDHLADLLPTLRPGQTLTVTYYHHSHYRQVTATLEKIDHHNLALHFPQLTLPFAQILSLKIL